ncbi:MAG TPA: hypothetical protein VFA85_18680 [Terriglobales bacterium]|nr:hypothetical protein [Terriglobales bacterium]
MRSRSPFSWPHPDQMRYQEVFSCPDQKFQEELSSLCFSDVQDLLRRAMRDLERGFDKKRRCYALLQPATALRLLSRIEALTRFWIEEWPERWSDPEREW